MARERESLLTLLNKTSEIETLLTTASGTGIPWQKTVLRTINDKPEFVLWKNQLKYQLQTAPQDQLIQETIALLDNGFKNGFTDERDFRELKAKLNLIAEHADRYEVELPDVPTTEKNQSMKKGTIVKTAFDEYTLIKQVGESGNGKVFSATNGHGESVAIKFVERSISATKLKRFKNEIHFCERHEYKNVVEILDRGCVTLDDTEYVFYVMPLYAETLRDKMKAKIIPEDAVTIFIGLIEGLGYAHKLGTIHRDIKPENIMFKAGSLEPIICDFGIAHFAEDELLTIIETKKGDRMANFQYAAPEQRVKGEAATAQTDIYAAALILNEMFTGEIPQAVDHKTIASVAPDYAYLDDVFAQLFKQKAEDRLYPEDKILIIPFAKDGEMLTTIIDRANKRLPPFSAAKDASDKGFKDCLLWLSILAYFKDNGEDEVIFVTDDKSAFRNNTEYLQKEFHEVTGKKIEIHPNSYYKELMKQPEKPAPEPAPEKKPEELPNLDNFREEVEEAIEGLRGVDWENYFGDPQWSQTFTTSVPFDKDYAKTFFAGLRRDIADHIFEKSVPASKLLDFDGRVIDCDTEIPMKNLEKALRIYQVVLSNYSQYSEQFFEAAAKILNRNYKAPPVLPFDLDDDGELPF